MWRDTVFVVLCLLCFITKEIQGLDEEDDLNDLASHQLEANVTKEIQRLDEEDDLDDLAPHQLDDPTPHQSDDPYPHQLDDLTPHQADDSTPHQSDNPYPHQLDDLTPHQSDDPTPHQSDDPYPHQLDDLTPHQSDDPTPPQSDDPYPHQLKDSDLGPPRAMRSIDNCAANSTDSCCLHFDCMKNYICCTNLGPKPSNCPAVILRCCPPPPPPTYCQANFICCTNAEPKPLICQQVKPRCCPDPPPPPPPPPLPICQANYICCTNTAAKPYICDQIIPQCCPVLPPPPCPTPPAITCPTPPPPVVLPFCQRNFKCCSKEEPKPYNCWQVIPRCCPAQPPPDPCPPTPVPPRPCPGPMPLPYCQRNYLCCTHMVQKPYNCPMVVPRCCPKPSCPAPPPPKPCPPQTYCQENYICCTNAAVKPAICSQVTPVCCPKQPPVPDPIPPRYPTCPGPCPYQPPPCMAGCPPYYNYFSSYYYPGNFPGYYPGNMRAPPQWTNGSNGRRRRRDVSTEEPLNGSTIDSVKPCNCTTFTNNSLVTVFVTSASQDSYKLLRNQIQIFKNNLKDAITVEILAYGNATSGNDTSETECEFGEGDCLGNRLLSCASDMSEDDASIMGFATCIMSSSLLITNGTETRILTKAKMCASKYSYSWSDLRNCTMNGEGELLLKQAGKRQNEIDSSLEKVPAVYYNEEPVWTQSNEMSELPKHLCKHLVDVPAGRVLCRRMTFFNYGDLKEHLQKTQDKPKRSQP